MNLLISVDSKKPLVRLRDDIPRACAAHKFGVLHVHDLRSKMREKGVEFDRETLIFDVCNPQQAKRVLEQHAEVATAMPCRIAAFDAGNGTTRLATLRPTGIIGLFGAGDLEVVAAEVEKTLGEIMQEAAR